MDFLWDVTDCKIERICTLIPKQGQLCFITRKNDRDYCCTWVVLLQLFLNKPVGCSAWKSGPKTGKKPRPDRDQTALGPQICRTGKDRNRGPVFGLS